jgi:hypothetical protein
VCPELTWVLITMCLCICCVNDLRLLRLQTEGLSFAMQAGVTVQVSLNNHLNSDMDVPRPSREGSKRSVYIEHTSITMSSGTVCQL